MLVLVYSRPQGSFSVAFFLTSSRVIDRRHDDGEVRHGQLVLADEVDAECVVVDDDELLGLLQRARLHLEGRKPPTVTARSNDHFTSLAVIGVPSWNLAFLAQLEGDRRVGGVPVLGQLGREVVAVVGDVPSGSVLVPCDIRRS